MKVIGRPKLLAVMGTQIDGRQTLQAWLKEVESARWKTAGEMLAHLPHTRTLPAGRFAFTLRGRQLCIVTVVNFPSEIVLIERIESQSQGSLFIS